METLQEIITKESINKDCEKSENAQAELCQQVQEESQVIVHCSIELGYSRGIRVWRTTFLFDKDSSHKSSLLNAQNIAIFPAHWTMVRGRDMAHFTLIFSALPKGCTRFDLEEFAGDSGPFRARDIQRNSTDVYRVELMFGGRVLVNG